MSNELEHVDGSTFLILIIITILGLGLVYYINTVWPLPPGMV